MLVVAADVVETGDLPDEVTFAHLDVRTSSSIATLVDKACRLGTLQAVVNCHGILRETPPFAFDEAIAAKVLDVNFVCVARMCQAAAGYIADGGAIVNISITTSLGRVQNALIHQSFKLAIELIELLRVHRTCSSPERDFSALAANFERIGVPDRAPLERV